MSLITVPSYEGNHPFIYVYYAEEDTRLALPVLARLYNEGLRMWSWNGCSQPTEVRASQRISSCAALLIFLSDNLNRDVDRGYFEAMEALRCNKIKHFVRLSDVELPFDWGKSETNIIIDYVRSNEAAFWLSIYDSDVIERCRGAWPSQPIKTGLSAYEAVDSSEVSDEYSSILRIIGDSPALDRSGIPMNAEDIALFAGAGEAEEKQSEPEQAVQSEEILLDDLNRRSMEDLFGILDEISLSTRQKAEELQQAAEARQQAQEKAAMAKASLPFQQDVALIEHPDEPPAPALRFVNVTHWIETAAREMFGEDLVPVQSSNTEEETLSGKQAEYMAAEMFGAEAAGIAAEEESEIVIVDIQPLACEESAEAEKLPEPSLPSFEAFIDELAYGGETPSEEDSTSYEETAEETAESAEQPETEAAAEPEPVYLPTNPKTVEIIEENTASLLPPASGSLTGFTLPDDNYLSTVYVVNDDEGDALPTAAERAAAAEESRKQFESALEKAAYTVTGRIVARHTKSDRSVGLRVRKPKAERISITAKVKTVKVAPTAVRREAAAPEPIEEIPLSRAERRARRRKASEPAEAAAETQEVSAGVTVTPEPMRGEMPSCFVSSPASETVTAEGTEGETDATDAAAKRRKNRHPHNSSGLLDLLRNLRSHSTSEAEETE